MDDIVTRLRNTDWIEDIGIEETYEEAADEIERLRTAGDNLAAAIRNHDLREAHLKAWEEARRG